MSSLWSRENLFKLINMAESRMSKKFTGKEAEILFTFGQQLIFPPNIKAQHPDDQLKWVLDNFITMQNLGEDTDVKEMLKAEMSGRLGDPSKFKASSKEYLEGSPSLLNMDAQSLVRITKILNRESLFRDTHILLDSRYQNRSNQDRSRIVFSVLSGTRVKTPGSGTVIASGSIRDIVEIEIFPFSIPYMTNADNYYNTITMSIVELSASSIDAYEDSQFHFMFKSSKNLNLLELTPLNRVYQFHEPIARIGDMTIRFGSPLRPIEFDRDTLKTISINYASNPMVVEFAQQHNLLSGDLIYFENFTTADPIQDITIIREINSVNGHVCTRISSTSISINIDATRVRFPDISAQHSVYLGSKRVFIPMRIRYMP